MKFAILALALASLTGTALAAAPAKKAIVAYVFPQERALGPDEVAAGLLTRVNYAFANIKHGKVVAGFAHDRENFRTLNALKKTNPSLEILVSVGGWTWSGAFSDAALDTASRKVFIDSAVQFIRDHHLDGLDIDWEYPGLPGNGNTHRPEDKEHYTALLHEMRIAFDDAQKSLGRQLILSIAAGASDEFIDHTEMSKVARYVDSVNLMSYDYYLPDSDKIAGHHAALFTNPADPKHASADDSVKQFEAAGVPASKLILGVPFYGHMWAQVEPTCHGLYQPGKKTNVWVNYSEIPENYLKKGFVRYWDSAASAPYLYNPVTHAFVSYDDPESIGLKCRYVLRHDLAGIMFWDYAGDSADHTLLNSIHRELHH
jgi:chitinase